MKNKERSSFLVSGPELLNGWTYLHENLSQNLLSSLDVIFWGFKSCIKYNKLEILKKYLNSINSSSASSGQLQSHLPEIL